MAVLIVGHIQVHIVVPTVVHIVHRLSIMVLIRARTHLHTQVRMVAPTVHLSSIMVPTRVLTLLLTVVPIHLLIVATAVVLSHVVHAAATQRPTLPHTAVLTLLLYTRVLTHPLYILGPILPLYTLVRTLLHIFLRRHLRQLSCLLFSPLLYQL